jgi:hypothetical protein
MRKLLISVAAAGAALAIATPAAAQYYPQQQYGYGQQYGAPYGNAYGYNNRGQLQAELQRIRYQADNLARQGRLTRSEARDLYGDIQSAQRQLYRSNSPWAARELNQKIARIRYELRRYADYDRRGRYGNYGYNNYNNGYYDRDRDGRDDRYEDDRGYQRDR